MILKSFSKINLSLNINKKIKNSRYHEIQSYFCLVSLYDDIKVKKIKGQKDEIRFQGKFSKYIKKNSNTIIDVLKILRKRNLISSYYSIFINKRIPVFGGMGGGTSNAICLVRHFIRNKLSKNLLGVLSKKIGSDSRLFLYKQGFLKNLNTINNFQIKHNLYFLLVYPNIKCSTRYIYSKVKKFTSKSDFSYKKINAKNKFIKLLLGENNNLQSIVENKYPNIKRLIVEISQRKGCYFSRMTGSGSVCYGVFKSKKSAKAALNVIKLKYPKYWSWVAKTI
ncbi:MAG: 4-(cytidine 5'-diphospho)-2-C-methyl-D-erythritol kinase [Candidatus Pelagibacter sp. TMED263]|nr:MAG: 4-(cytidine 5'-diphospho)-2-C-methyl-D-erythritol kinase [Candidatus Pelagibacter sp. TMED263]|tara:strand:- start:77 stop:916 length:840 start_codon:yes stop_codon:yes gene_type:complete